jgi:uncharacterized protein
MERQIDQELKNWKESPNRKPLILQGPRQVGKTFALKEFGRHSFVQTHYLNFEETPQAKLIFEKDLTPHRILDDLSLHFGQTIHPENDLLILDEIQECPQAVTAMKYFCENKRELAVCCAGSLLGVALNQSSFPVGKVDFLYLSPMNFGEFLRGIGDSQGAQALEKIQFSSSPSEFSHHHLWEQLKLYYITGGLPEVVSVFSQNRDQKLLAFQVVRELQKSLLLGYKNDISKHAGKVNALHIERVFQSIPMQLANSTDDSVKRFRFKDVLGPRTGTRELEGPIDWLIKAGLIIKVKLCNRPQLPLESYCKPNLFKLFIFDIGLLGCMLNLSPQTLLRQDFGIAKGYFAENFVAEALSSSMGTQELYSWAEGTAELEFLLAADQGVIPLEVKSGTRTKAKSLRVFQEKHKPPYSVILSANPLSINQERRVLYLPLYISHTLVDITARNLVENLF